MGLSGIMDAVGSEDRDVEVGDDFASNQVYRFVVGRVDLPFWAHKFPELDIVDDSVEEDDEDDNEDSKDDDDLEELNNEIFEESGSDEGSQVGDTEVLGG